MGANSGNVTSFHDVQALKANTFKFNPIKTEFVRIKINASSLSQPCIDELEIFGLGSKKNLALASAGAVAKASSSLTGHNIHKIEHLNDGQYKNARSWICGKNTGWCEVKMPKPAMINRVVLSRDRDGKLQDRTPVSFDIQVSMNGKDWTTVKKVRPPKPLPSSYTLFNPAALRRALDDLASTTPDLYPNLADLRREVDAAVKDWPALLTKAKQGDSSAIKEADRLVALQRSILLRNPLINFDKVLLVKRHRKKDGLPVNFHGLSFIDRGPHGFDNEIAVMEMKTGKLTTLYRPESDVYVGEVDLHFNAKKMLFSQVDKENTWQVYEINTDGSSLRQVTPSKPELKDIGNYDAIYLPDGRIIFGSTSGFAGVPCHGGKGDVANLHIMNSDGSGIRRLTYEQDHDWYPVMLPNGRVMYLRWEYTDSAHYFSRIMMTMNPDGTGQVEHYGSNSYWPNAMFYARPLPGSSSKFAAIVTGHHGVRRAGRLVLFDVAKGRHETSGIIQQIPGHGKEVPAPIKDHLVDGVWPQFLHPYPLSDKYFLVSCKPSPTSEWGLYLVDIYDNMLPVKEIPDYLLFEPVPIRKTKTPPVIPDKVRLESKTATCFIQDINEGRGLKGVPRGAVKSLRIYNFDYGYRMMGGHYLIGMESGWDVKRLLGTVPVYEDGSAFFTIPANQPVAIQPLDEKGRTLQQMRSWLVGMPGENVSCIGCHEDQNQAVTVRRTVASSKPPIEIKPWYGPARGFSFLREVQPVLNRYCVGCHDGKETDRPDFANITREGKDGQLSGYPHSYISLHPYVRRNGPEGDYHLLTPLEFHANTSKLVQMLEKGHHNVKLDAESWDRINTWIDMNVPCHGTWSEVRPVPSNYIQRRREMEKLYANVEINLEKLHHKADYDDKYVAPEPLSEIPEKTLHAANWPFNTEEAKSMQTGNATSSLSLGNRITLELTKIPAGEFIMGSRDGAVDERPRTKARIGKSFWMGTMEVSLEQYHQFNPDHRNRVYDMHYKDQVKPGYDMDKPELPAIRMSWNEAIEFCEWLSKKTGRKVTLPTEAQWEWACRAGTESPFSYGTLDSDFSKYANLADQSISKLAVIGVNPQPVKNPNKYWDFELKDARFNDHTIHLAQIKSHTPNAWGLLNMHGNVAEWTRSAYTPYPYRTTDGRNDASKESNRVARGGSWHDRPKRASSSFRLAYPQWQKVFNIGFRVVVEDK